MFLPFFFIFGFLVYYFFQIFLIPWTKIYFVMQWLNLVTATKPYDSDYKFWAHIKSILYSHQGFTPYQHPQGPCWYQLGSTRGNKTYHLYISYLIPFHVWNSHLVPRRLIIPDSETPNYPILCLPRGGDKSPRRQKSKVLNTLFLDKDKFKQGSHIRTKLRLEEFNKKENLFQKR